MGPFAKDKSYVITQNNEKSGDMPSSANNSFQNQQNRIELPALSLPKGGGAIKGIEEKFQVNALTGTSSFNIPLPLSPSRNGFVPPVGLSYNSGNGNGSFGLGWQLAIASVARKTGKQIPQYKDSEESDTFTLSGAEDLVPLLEKQMTVAGKDITSRKLSTGKIIT